MKMGTLWVRAMAAAALVSCLSTGQTASSPPGSPPAARQFVNRLFREYPDALNDEGRARIFEALNAYLRADRGGPPTPEYDNAASALLNLYTQAPNLIAVEQGRAVEGAVDVPFGAMPALIYRRGKGHLEFVWRKVAVAAQSGPLVIEASPEAPLLCGIELTDVPPEGKAIEVLLRGPAQSDSKVTLRARAVPGVPLTVSLETGGRPTEAVAAFYSEGKRLIVPETALNFRDGGEGYGNTQYLYNRTSRYWPGKRDYVRSFYHAGAFTVAVAPGTYRLMVVKGPEFEPVDRTITISAGKPHSEQVDLKRWVNMAARGWYSGDCHVHYERKTADVNEALELWARSEDVHMVNVMAMGDGRYTYFEQYAWGKPGWHRTKDVAIVPGQEDPRTNILGHTVQLNLTAPVRFMPESYYIYSDVADQVHRQGGLSGYVHANNQLFNVNRGMTLDVPLGIVDFVEFCEAGNVKPALYYEFLNLGYRLTAAGGSDVPYYGSIGDSRTYAYIGGAFSPEAWLDAFAKGHTFVTAGPMLEFTAGGRLPGDRLTARRSDVLHIKAKVEAGKGMRSPERLEVVVNGQVVRSAAAQLEFDLPVTESMWIAARCTGAHTTPVYVTVGGQRHWSRSEAAALIQKRLRTLDETEKLLGTKLSEGGRILWESNDAFGRDAERLRKAIARAREEYRKLEAELK